MRGGTNLLLDSLSNHLVFLLFEFLQQFLHFLLFVYFIIWLPVIMIMMGMGIIIIIRSCASISHIGEYRCFYNNIWLYIQWVTVVSEYVLYFIMVILLKEVVGRPRAIIHVQQLVWIWRLLSRLVLVRFPRRPVLIHIKIIWIIVLFGFPSWG